MPLICNTSYLDRTPNREAQHAGARWVGVIWHETDSPHPDDPRSTLNFNLSAAAQSSYHYLIAADGTIYHYVDERAGHVAWHAGKSAAFGYKDSAVNQHTLGVEIDKRVDHHPPTEAQMASAAFLAVYFSEEYGIPIDRAFHREHREIAPGRKYDPCGYTPDEILVRARALARTRALVAARPPAPAQ